MSTSLLNDPLLTPAEVAPLLRMSAKAVRLLCQTNTIRHEEQRSEGGRIRYFIPESAVADFRRRRTRGGHR